MVKLSTESIHLIERVRQRYENAICQSSQLCRLIAHLSYEGKLNYGKNLHKAKEMIGWIEHEVGYHMKMEDDVIYPFLMAHVPRLERLLMALKDEHVLFRRKTMQLRRSISHLSVRTPVLRRAKWIGDIREKGIWLVYLIRQHLDTEKNNVYFWLERSLHHSEKADLESRLEEWIIKHSCHCHRFF